MLTAIDGLRAERMIVCRQRSGCVQTTLRKCTDPEVSSLFQRAVSVSGRVTATETTESGEDVCKQREDMETTCIRSSDDWL